MAMLGAALDMTLFEKYFSAFRETAPSEYDSISLEAFARRATLYFNGNSEENKGLWKISVYRGMSKRKNVYEQCKFAPMLDENMELQTLRQADGTLVPNLDIIKLVWSPRSGSYVPTEIMRPVMLQGRVKLMSRFETIHAYPSERLRELHNSVIEGRNTRTGSDRTNLDSPHDFYIHEFGRIKTLNAKLLHLKLEEDARLATKTKLRKAGRTAPSGKSRGGRRVAKPAAAGSTPEPAAVSNLSPLRTGSSELATEDSLDSLLYHPSESIPATQATSIEPSTSPLASTSAADAAWHDLFHPDWDRHGHPTDEQRFEELFAEYEIELHQALQEQSNKRQRLESQVDSVQSLSNTRASPGASKGLFPELWDQTDHPVEEQRVAELMAEYEAELNQVRHDQNSNLRWLEAQSINRGAPRAWSSPSASPPETQDWSFNLHPSLRTSTPETYDGMSVLFSPSWYNRHHPDDEEA